MAKYLAGSTTQAVKGTQGRLFGIIVHSHSNGTVKLNDGADGTATAGTKASGKLTVSGAISAGQKVTIGDRTYTFVTTFSSPTVPNEVAKGANTAAALDNLKAAINASGTPGVEYSTCQAHPNVTATTNTDTEQTVEFWKVGTEGNTLATTETLTNGAWGDATLTGGVNANTLILDTYTLGSGSSTLTFPAPVDFNSGLYLTIGGTVGYTIIYE